jgi:hypothetical protein
MGQVPDMGGYLGDLSGKKKESETERDEQMGKKMGSRVAGERGAEKVIKIFSIHASTPIDP